MKITIKCNPKEAAELMNALLNGAETEAKKPYFPPLLTNMANAKRTVENTCEIISFLKKIKEDAEQNEENAPQAETAEQEFVDPLAFESMVCLFADCIRNRPIKNGAIRKYNNMKLSEFARGDLFLK